MLAFLYPWGPREEQPSMQYTPLPGLRWVKYDNNAVA